MTENKDWEMYEHLKSRKISVREHYVSALIGISPFFLMIVGGVHSIANNPIALNWTFIAVALVFLVLPAIFICWSFKELHRRLNKQYQQPLLYGDDEAMHYGHHVFMRSLCSVGTVKHRPNRLVSGVEKGYIAVLDKYQSQTKIKFQGLSKEQIGHVVHYFG